jgi:hypothetical protein
MMQPVLGDSRQKLARQRLLEGSNRSGFLALSALPALSVLLFIVHLSAPASANANAGTATVRGTVTDEDLKPLGSVQLRLIEADQSTVCQAQTASNGQFVLNHKVCGNCALEVIPPHDSQLASAWIDDISGGQSRRIVVQLKKGFEVHGRIVHSQKGLKGITIAVVPIGQENKTHNLVHGSGWARTNRNGQFQMILTPGVKHLLITNERYPKLVGSMERKLSVARDSVIPDIELESPSIHLPDNAQESSQTDNQL